VDKNRVFQLLRLRGASKAVVSFSGGNDEGDVDSIKLTIGDEQIDLDVWWEGDQTDHPDKELSVLLAAPVWERYGGFAGDFQVYGIVTFDVAAGTVVMSKEETAYQHGEIEF
jgi:hypothetical protein